MYYRLVEAANNTQRQEKVENSQNSKNWKPYKKYTIMYN